MNRYDGPDGAKRIELLEKLASLVTRWRAKDPTVIWPAILLASIAIDRDNKRVSRLKENSND